MKQNEQVIVFSDPFSDEKFGPIAYVNDWDWSEDIPESEDHPYEAIYLTDDEQTSLHFVDDSFLDVRYLRVRGADAEKTAARVREVTPALDDEEILRSAREATDREERIRGILRSAVLASGGTRSPVFLEISREAKSHPEPTVRRAAVMAMSYLGWPELREIIAEYRSDPDPEVREDAAALLEGYELQDQGRLE